ncbi:hypothetical protein AGDE_08829 [Angomonas deanei]|nr:hypothetical protein AGDE_08829 [Angomonas deanei]|eukprot:EPY32167.1 hypothetical protein AGDE_08829 [Angomonas deanei]
MKERQAYIEAAIEKGELPKNFWATVAIALFKIFGNSEESPHFLGPYDEKLLNEHLEKIEATHTAAKNKIVFHFRPNPFFSETALWAEEAASGEWDFSGITWQEGYGPQLEEEASQPPPSGEKRPREEAAGDVHTGPSVLDLFSVMPLHPDDDEELDVDDEEAEDLVEEWEAEMDERDALLVALLQKMLIDPIAVLDEAEAIKKAEEAAVESLKRAKPDGAQ